MPLISEHQWRVLSTWVALCSVRTSRQPDARGATFDEVFGTLIAGGMSQDALFEAACRSHTEIVLTAHPTQVNRRTLQCVPQTPILCRPQPQSFAFSAPRRYHPCIIPCQVSFGIKVHSCGAL